VESTSEISAKDYQTTKRNIPEGILKFVIHLKELMTFTDFIRFRTGRAVESGQHDNKHMGFTKGVKFHYLHDYYGLV
jgi:hypothetical protein